MSGNPVVTDVELIWFAYDLPDLGLDPILKVPLYEPGATWTRTCYIVRVHTDAGVSGEYVGDRNADGDVIPRIAPLLVGRDATDRLGFFEEARRALLISGHLMGLGSLDVALWDLAGKLHAAPLYELLGGRRRPLPAYASTHCGDRRPDGFGSAEAYADHAEACLEMGFRGYKIHPWPDGPTEDMIAIVRAVGERVAGRMDLMIDPFNSIRTFGECVRVGRACDDYGYYWLEDPFRDGGVSIHAHRKLRQLVRTPILMLEHVRGLEAHADAIEREATDFVRLDPDYDGVTATMKIARTAEGFGLDAELHGSGPVRRHIMAALSNSNYYEVSLLHPRTGPFHPPVYTAFDDFTDSIDGDGCVDVPDGPGLGVEIDWDFVQAHRIGP